jgi:hypothetical protein
VRCGDLVVLRCILFQGVFIRCLFSTLPPPPWGYFAAMSFIMNGLRRVSVCKIFITKELFAKYWK